MPQLCWVHKYITFDVNLLSGYQSLVCGSGCPSTHMIHSNLHCPCTVRAAACSNESLFKAIENVELRQVFLILQ